MAAYDDLNGTRITVISVISITVTAVTVLAVQVLYFAMAGYVDSKKVDTATYTRSNKVLSEQAAEVSRYGVDPETGNVVVPVEQVIRQMASENQATDSANDSV